MQNLLRLILFSILLLSSYLGYAASGNSLSFTASRSSYVLFNRPASVQDDFTIEYWVNTTMTGPTTTNWYSGAGLVDGEMPTSTNDFGTSLVNGGKLAFGVGSPDVTIQSVTSINDGKWHHVAVTRVKATGLMAIYIDGVQEATSAGTTTNKNSLSAATTLRMGSIQTGAPYFTGQLDEVRLWSVVRTPAQIAASKNYVVASGTTSLAAYYRLDEGTGLTANGTGAGTAGTLLPATTPPQWVVPSTAPIYDPATSITGTVFDDVNYGGGTGRPLATAITSANASGFTASLGRPNARVELYTSTGAYSTFTTTDASGFYGFAGLSAGGYTVRVVSSTVTPARPASATGLVPVQTFRTVNGADDGNRVGGENPAFADPGANTTATVLGTTINLSFVGLNASNDNTMFIDEVEVLQGGTPLAANPIVNPGFENGTLTANGGAYQYNPSGAGIGWTFTSISGIQSNNSAFTPPNTTFGARAGLVQGYQNTNSSISQSFTLPAGTYTIRFQAANRNFGGRQSINVVVNGTTLLASQQAPVGSYSAYQTASFTVSNTGQNIAPVALSSSTPGDGVDFGFNFDVVTNTNTSGQGSLRQFILNANALGGEANLQQAGYYLNQIVGANPINTALPANVESSIFMVPSGNARPGLLAFSGTAAGGPASQLTNGVAVIAPTNALPLPAISGPATAINGWTQSFNLTNTNNVTLGTGGTVGTNNIVLPQVNGPEVQITGTSAVAVGLDVASAATGSSILGLAIYGFGSTGDDSGYGNIRIAANQVAVQGTVVGGAATSFGLPAGGTVADGIRVTAGTGLSLTNNLIGYNSGKGITTVSGVTGASITLNEIRSNGLGNSTWDGLDLQGSASTISNNLFINNAGVGMDGYQTAGGNTWSGNTVTGNGAGTATNAPGETPGVRIYGANNTVTQNIITGNYGAGIMVTPTATKAVISKNVISGNGAVKAANNAAATGQIGIDLQATGQSDATGASAYVTLNSTATGGGNSLVNYPILQSARLNGTNLVVQGLAAVGLTVELFLATPNAVTSTTPGNNFGQGSAFIGAQTLTSSGATASYGPADVNGFPQGSGTNVNSFTITIALGSLTADQRTALTSSGAKLTATATSASLGTSEFSGNVTVTSGPTAFNTTNLNVAMNSAGAALNPGLTVPQAASDPANPIVAFVVYPATNGTLYYSGAPVTAAGGVGLNASNAYLLSFMPATNSTLSGTFNFYAVNSLNVASNTATYTIPVIASSNAYVANDDGLDVPQSTASKGNVLLNDTQPADASVAFTVTQVGPAPAHGTLALNADGTYTYTPTANYLGTDTFQYQVCQSNVCSNTATVTLRMYDAALVCSSATGPNLLQNADFEQGNTGFTSAYSYVSAAANAATTNGNRGLVPETTYAVDVNANTYHGSFTGTGRGGKGNFMIVNGAANQSKIYAQTVNVVSNRYYTYSGWATSVNPASPAILGFVINGKSTSASSTLPTTTGTYVQFSGVWFSGNASGTASFEVRDINRDAGGNDFGIDDLYFGTCSVNLLAMNITNSPGIPAQAPATSIAPLDATINGPGAAVASFVIQTLPTSGILRLGGPSGAVVTLGQVIPVAQRSALYYTPAAGYAGNATFTYTATDTENAGSNNIATYTIPVSSAPLPVSLTTFTARPVGTAAQLDWNTATEQNNAYFAVERSTTGQAADFTAIGQVAGQGTKLTPTAYHFTDRNAAANGQLVYYRLRQVDKDGTSSLSPVRAVSFGAAATTSLSLYPNPTAGPGTSLDLGALPATATYQVRLLDATGRTARQWELRGGQAQPLDVSDLASGTYLLLVSGTTADGGALRQVLHLTKE